MELVVDGERTGTLGMSVRDSKEEQGRFLMPQDHPCLIRSQAVAELPELPVPMHLTNPQLLIYLRSLSAAAGLQRLGLHIGRVPAGAESFSYLLPSL